MNTQNKSVFAERLTPGNAVIAMIDHQTGLLLSCRDQDVHLTKANIRGLCSMAKTLDLPSVITASMPQGPNGPIMPDILELLGNNVIERSGEINAWDNTDFKGAIEATGRKKIIMAGVVTDVCLMFPAISAVADGYDVYAVVDASGTWNETVRNAAMMRMTQAGVKVTTWAAVLAELMHDWRSEKGMELGGVLGEHTSYQWVYDSFLAAQPNSK
ncbi:hydrolase [Photobacterium profundum]|uniref:Hydrolase, isochorismatase family protein n=1 Tax=Photobacterium profundum 3TCK TaxID=314280 RepID=Q1YXB6_9GAMM|nr:isochorismatase family protein [Photobacterium profundum]EAS40932.1 hydrolase, isochorismatase family protein [Photobacterium profundum 3TCK]PSV63629.1 hydrolase [Photobacterium profundum]